MYLHSHTFKNILKEASVPYRELLKQKTDISMKQKEISQFYEKILPETPTCNENRNTTTPSTSSQMKEKDLPKKNQIMQNFLDKKASKNNMKTAKNSSGKGILVIDIDDENQSNHNDFIKICGKCEKVATHFCQTCNDNLCKFCIIDHYKNPDFTKDHEMIPI